MSSLPPLHLEASRGDLGKVQVLLKEGGLSLGSRSDDGLTPLMHSIHNNHKQVASYLVDEMNGKDLVVEDIFGYNVLHYLARDGRPWLQVMKTICEKCPEAIQQVNYKGRRPIDIAREKLDDNPGQRNHREVIEYLEKLAHYQVKKGISDKMIQTCNITITFIGNNGSGKTCLRKQLSREAFPINGPGSTNLAEFLANYMDWDPLTGFRQKLDEGGEEATGIERLRRIFKRYSAQQTVGEIPGTGQNEKVTEKPDDKPRRSEETDISSIIDVDTSHTQQELVGDILHQYDDDTYWYDRELDDDFPNDESDEENIHEFEKKNENPKEKESDTIKGFITLYDFGGETIFYNTHHCFMSGDMVFILLFDVAMCVDAEKGEKEIKSIEKWLFSVGTYSIDDDGVSGTPPIILVGSHLDQVPGSEEDKLKVFGSILDKLYENRRLRRIMENNVHDMFPISNLNDSSKHEDLYEKMWRKIFEVAPFQSEWRKLVPARWVAIEQELLKRKRSGIDIITYPQLREINQHLLVPLSDEDDIQRFLKKLQITGSMLVINLHSNPVIILNPNFVLDALKCIITNPKFTHGFKERMKWNAFAKSGKLPLSDLHAFLRNETTRSFSNYQDIIEVAMETFGLFAKPISDDSGIDYYIVPCMLLEADPDLLQPLLAETDVVTSSSLCFKFEKEFIPFAIWDKVVASCIHRFYCINEHVNDPSIFVRRGFVCLAVDNLWNIVINCNRNAMKVTMFRRDRGHQLPIGSGIQVRNILEYLLQNVLEKNRQNHLKYEFYLHHDFRFSSDDKMIKVDHLKSVSLPCYSSSSGRGWISIEDYRFWFLKTGDRRGHHSGTAEFLINDDVLNRRPSHKEAGRIAKLISGRGYQMFFSDLFLPMHVLDQIMEETRNASFRTRITRIFLHLLNTRPDLTVAEIAAAMQRHEMPYDNLAMTLETNRVNMCNGDDLPKEVLDKLILTLNLAAVANHISAKSYYNLFLELGVDSKAIDRFDVDHDKISDRIRALLQKWIRDNGKSATAKQLLLAMKECDMDTQSLVDYISDVI